MEKLKVALGPYEVFASIIGGFPLVLAVLLLYSPPGGLLSVFLSIKDNLSFPVVLLAAFCSYILGGSIQGLTWRYFVWLCKIFDRDYSYFGSRLHEREAQLLQPSLSQLSFPQPSTLVNQTSLAQTSLSFEGLGFEDKLVVLLRKHIGLPKRVSWLNTRLASYLKEHSSGALATAEYYVANHIMNRNLSFGFLLLPVVLFINLFRGGAVVETLAFIALSLFIAYTSFFQSLAFKRWQNRELLLGFYFSAEKREAASSSAAKA